MHDYQTTTFDNFNNKLTNFDVLLARVENITNNNNNYMYSFSRLVLFHHTHPDEPRFKSSPVETSMDKHDALTGRWPYLLNVY